MISKKHPIDPTDKRKCRCRRPIPKQRTKWVKWALNLLKNREKRPFLAEFSEKAVFLNSESPFLALNRPLGARIGCLRLGFARAQERAEFQSAAARNRLRLGLPAALVRLLRRPRLPDHRAASFYGARPFCEIIERGHFMERGHFAG